MAVCFLKSADSPQQYVNRHQRNNAALKRISNGPYVKGCLVPKVLHFPCLFLMLFALSRGLTIFPSWLLWLTPHFSLSVFQVLRSLEDFRRIAAYTASFYVNQFSGWMQTGVTTARHTDSGRRLVAASAAQPADAAAAAPRAARPGPARPTAPCRGCDYTATVANPEWLNRTCRLNRCD